MPFHINPEDRSLMLEFIDANRPDELIIYSDPNRHEIGLTDESHIGLGTDEIHTLVRMVFHDVRSLDVLIKQASILMDSMRKNI